MTVSPGPLLGPKKTKLMGKTEARWKEAPGLMPDIPILTTMKTTMMLPNYPMQNQAPTWLREIFPRAPNLFLRHLKNLSRLMKKITRRPERD